MESLLTEWKTHMDRRFTKIGHGNWCEKATILLPVTIRTTYMLLFRKCLISSVSAMQQLSSEGDPNDPNINTPEPQTQRTWAAEHKLPWEKWEILWDESKLLRGKWQDKEGVWLFNWGFNYVVINILVIKQFLWHRRNCKKPTALLWLSVILHDCHQGAPDLRGKGHWGRRLRPRSVWDRPLRSRK